MRKFIILLIFIFVVSSTYTRANSQNLEGTTIDSTLNESGLTQITNVGYRLFPTENMWTFIKLNTRNGQMWQVQYDVGGDNRFETYLNFVPLVPKEKEENGRFMLYSTQNIYTFILLDQIDGKMWQVQWSIESEERLIIPIE
ncbi:MAG: hypothetical protein R6X28_05525 [Bacteroidales bacterium]